MTDRQIRKRSHRAFRKKKVCGIFFDITGNFVEFSCKVKSPPGRIVLRRRGIMLLERPAAAGFFLVYRYFSTRGKGSGPRRSSFSWNSFSEKVSPSRSFVSERSCENDRDPTQYFR